MQIIKYAWENWEPFFIFQDGDSFGKMKLMHQNINLVLGEKRCIGYFKNGKHFLCPNNSRVVYEHSCENCQRSDDFFGCMKCDGTVCKNPEQRECCEKNNYFIYLAAFDSLLKVGISIEFRLLQRLVEQGADFAAKIALVRDGLKARTLEHDIEKMLGITDRVRGKEKEKKLLGDPNKSMQRIITSITRLKSIKGANMFGIKPEIYDLRHYYNLQNVLKEPLSINNYKDKIVLKGNITAAKGNIIIIKRNGNYYSINAHRLIGRYVLKNNKLF